MGLEKERIEEKLDRAELLVLHEHYATEMRTALDFAHRNLSFYVGCYLPSSQPFLLESLRLAREIFAHFGCLPGPAWRYG
jgi:hypothetical protein